MPDYQEMYLTLFRAAEQAENTLIAAQQKCEELYLSAPQGERTVLPKEQEREKNKTAAWRSLPYRCLCMDRKRLQKHLLLEPLAQREGFEPSWDCSQTDFECFTPNTL